MGADDGGAAGSGLTAFFFLGAAFFVVFFGVAFLVAFFFGAARNKGVANPSKMSNIVTSA